MRVQFLAAQLAKLENGDTCDCEIFAHVYRNSRVPTMRMENFSASAVKVENRELWQLCQVKTRFNPSVEQRPLPSDSMFLAKLMHLKVRHETEGVPN